MKIIYINYNDFSQQAKSASALRPKKIYDTFLELGYEVDMLSGQLERAGKKERKVIVDNFYNKIKNNSYDYCYIEGLTKSFFKFYNYCDVKLIKKIKKKGVPIGVFYRDMYWKFYKEKGLKNKIYYLLQKWEVAFYKKTCKTIFVPSLEMGKYLKTTKTIALPPACENVKAQKAINDCPTGIYVGAVNVKMGTTLLLEAYKIANVERRVCLNLVYRENEGEIVDKFVAENGKADWLNCLHLSSEDIALAYNASDFSIIPLQKDTYKDFAVPVKLFEYVSYLKPIVATNCNEVANFINNNKIGIICKDTVDSLAKAILEMADCFNSFDLQSCKEKNFWKDRVETITKTLTQE